MRNRVTLQSPGNERTTSFGDIVNGVHTPTVSSCSHWIEKKPQSEGATRSRGFSASNASPCSPQSKPVQYLYDTVATIKKMSAPAKASPRGFSSSLDATMTTARNSTNDSKQHATSFRKDMTRGAWNMGVSRCFRSERGERIRKPKGRQVCRSGT